MNAFITGSYAYGTARPDSDIDLVILTDHTTKNLLWLLSGATEEKPLVRFGKLNVIVVTDATEFATWKFSTACTIRLIAGGDEMTRGDIVHNFLEDARLAGVRQTEMNSGGSE